MKNRMCIAAGVAATLMVAGVGVGAAVAEEPHAVTLDDIGNIHGLDSLKCSADGKWAVYTATANDVKADKRRTAVWLAPLAGGEPLALTAEDESSSAPAFSPDGRFISFLSKRGKDEHSQIWLLDRRGGEARRLTDVSGDIDSYRWSPDSKRLLIVMTNQQTADQDKPKPKVIDDLHFKQDDVGFITADDHDHLYVFDLAAKSLVRVTGDGSFDEKHAEWSPDGSQIAFIADHDADQAAPATHWLELVAAQKGAEPHLVAKIPAAGHQALMWSDDGKRIYHLAGDAPKVNEYSQARLAATELDSGATRILRGGIDRSVSKPVVLGPGRIGVLVADDRRVYAAQIDAAKDTLTRLTDGGLTITDQCGGNGARAVIASGDGSLPELYALDGKTLRPLSSHNKALSAAIRWGEVEDFSARGADGSEPHGLMVKPAGFTAGRRYPTILWIHGGPNEQDAHWLQSGGDMLVRQWLAAHGYLVLAVNYRGSSGRGDEYARTIAADWGNKEVIDLEASLDWAIAQGYADPQRLGVGGWSYGGILTDFLIVRDSRFKAALSGAGEGNLFGLFGIDQYIKQYAQELGAPWSHAELYTRLSEPFFHADRIKTPTLFMGGTSDDNVPLAGGQQLYEALKLTGVETRLIAYPGANHALRRPSFVIDRLQRMLDWYDGHLGEKEKS